MIITFVSEIGRKSAKIHDKTSTYISRSEQIARLPTCFYCSLGCPEHIDIGGLLLSS